MIVIVDELAMDNTDGGMNGILYGNLYVIETCT